MTKKILFAFFFFQLFFNVGYAQIKNIGIPFIRNFPKREYKAGTQNWSIAQDQKGFMYFANNEGLVVFDGIVWQLYKMPNSSITRSVYIDENESIYIGAYNELGKMVFGSNGKLEFQSLKKYIPSEYQNFDDIWNITSFEGKIVFQSYSSAFIYNNDTTVTVIKAPFRFQNSYKVKEKLFFNDIEKGLQNNTVLKVFADKSGDLWLGLDNGIDYININSPITFLKDGDGIGTGY